MSDRADISATPDRDAPIRRSVELEYWVIDEQGDLVAPGDLVDAAPGVEREFVAPLLEVKTTPCESTAELRDELFDRLGRVLRRADQQGMGLVPLATPISHDEIADRPNKRTEIQDRVLGENFEHVRHCAGLHIHVEQQPGLAIDQLNTLTALDPALALVNSSPYFRGRYLTAGARSKLYRWLAYERLPHQGELWPYADSTDEWATRLERRYSEFVTDAVLAGYDRETVEAHFGPESGVWTPVKLREEFSTVEWRSPDTTLPSQAVRLADDIVDVMAHLRDARLQIRGDNGRITSHRVVLPEFETLREFVDASIRDGLESEAVRAYLERMGFDLSAYAPLSHELEATEKLSREDAALLRLEYAGRLASDVRRSIPQNAD